MPKSALLALDIVQTDQPGNQNGYIQHADGDSDSRQRPRPHAAAVARGAEENQAVIDELLP